MRQRPGPRQRREKRVELVERIDTLLGRLALLQARLEALEPRRPT